MKASGSSVRLVVFSSGGGYLECPGRPAKGLAALAKEMIGAEVVVMAPVEYAGAYAGMKVLRETAAVKGKKRRRVRPVVLVSTASGRKALSAADVQLVRFCDAGLQERFERAVETILSRKGLRIDGRLVDPKGRPAYLPAEQGPSAGATLLPLPSAPARVELGRIYNAEKDAGGAAEGLLLTNYSAVALAGRLTAYKFFDLAGGPEAVRVESGRKLLLRFPDSPRFPVQVSNDCRTQVLGAKISAGKLTVTDLRVLTRRYVVPNATGHNLPLVIEHPRGARRRLAEPEEYWETTPLHWRLLFQSIRHTVRTIPVREEEFPVRRIDLASGPVELLRELAADKKNLSREVRRALAEVIAMRERSGPSVKARLKKLRAE